VNTFISKYRLFAVVFLLAVISVKAQYVSTTELIVNLSEVKSITINESTFDIEILIENEEEMMQGKQFTQANHIEIVSTSDYEIKVYATSDLQGPTYTIPISTVRVIPQPGQGSYIGQGITFTEVTLATFEQSIIKSINGDGNRSFDIIYEVSGLGELPDIPAEVFNTTILYSIVSN
jgi:hypothetical protein